MNTNYLYVDDILFWAVNVNDIHDIATELRKQGVDLEQEDDAAGFLGITFGRDETTGLMGLIDRVIETLGLNDGMAKGKFIPAESTPLVKNSDGESPSVSFSYISIVGMLLYLSGYTRPDIAYAVNCCAKYMFLQGILMKQH